MDAGAILCLADVHGDADESQVIGYGIVGRQEQNWLRAPKVAQPNLSFLFLPTEQRHRTVDTMESIEISDVHTLEAVVVGLLVCLAFFYLPQVTYRAHLARLPILSLSGSNEEKRRAFLSACHQLYLKGYASVRMLPVPPPQN